MATQGDHGGVWTIGDVRVTRVAEQQAPLDIRALFPDADAAALETHGSWLRPHFLSDDGQIELSIHALVVESAGRVIVVDTCVGDRAMPGFEAVSGAGPNPFLERFAACGFDRERVDVVLCTHLHFDHIGWNTHRDGDRWVPTFPNARYLFDRTEFAHWSGAESHFTGDHAACVQPIVDAGLADLVDEGHVIDEHVRLVSTPGHTPGHVSVRIESRGEVAFITGDMTHHPVQWAEPDWKMMADSDSAQAAITRKDVGGALSGEGALVIGTHYPAPTAGWLTGSPGGLRFVTDRPGGDG